ncbi:hypothetical protein GGI00_005519, partial [Coemansia sp. RSA 2681]
MSSSKKAYETPSDSDSDAPVKPVAAAKKAPAKSSSGKTAYESPSDSEAEAPAKPAAPSKKSSSAKASSNKNVGFDVAISLDPFNDTHEKSSIQDNVV